MAKWNTILNPAKWNTIGQVAKINTVPFSYTIYLSSGCSVSPSSSTSYVGTYYVYASSPVPEKLYVPLVISIASGGVLSQYNLTISIQKGSTSGGQYIVFQRLSYNYNTDPWYGSPYFSPANSTGIIMTDGPTNVTILAAV